MELEKVLLRNGQEHVLKVLNSLHGAERAELKQTLSQIDWDVLSKRESVRPHGKTRPIEGLSVEQLRDGSEEYSEIGKKAISGGEVAAVLLAGGQGTRLGSERPKGTFDMGITRRLPIFRLLIERLLKVCVQCNAFVPLAVMTSEKNDAETRSFFEENGYFGYPEEYIGFFVQDLAPSVDFEGKLLFEEKGKLVRSPNGNGGWYLSLRRSGLLRKEAFASVKWFNVFAVDNVLQHIADPVFVGATIKSGCMTGAKVVKKVCPEERVGVLCLDEGRPRVVEYYELSEEMANERDEKGELCYRYGVILNYLFQAKRLEEIADEGIPVHVVKKKIPYLNEAGEKVVPEAPNGYKFETLILDMIELMGSCLPCEVVREKEFAPVKNKEGVDSVDTARALLEQNGVKL